jgi:transcriptional regulator with XRE-family HTH domain
MSRKSPEQKQTGGYTRAGKPRKISRPRATDYDVYIGERLRMARKLSGITLNDLATALGVTFQAVQKYENGENRMAAPRLFKAAQVLGTNIRFFAKPSEEDHAADDDAPFFTSDELDLLRHYRCISDGETRMALRKLVQNMAADDPARIIARGKKNVDGTKKS